MLGPQVRAGPKVEARPSRPSFIEMIKIMDESGW
jgi:hypothetical protein